MGGAAKPWHKRVRTPLLLLAFPCLVLLAVVLFGRDPEWWRDFQIRWHTMRWGWVEFTSEGWKSAEGYDPESVRGKMAQSLLVDHELRGMTHAEIIALLGRPEAADGVTTKDVPDSKLAQATSYKYFLGRYSDRSRIDADALMIEFDGGGHVCRTCFGEY